jgi:hypothetical protein
MTILNVSNVILDAITCVINLIEIVVINDWFHREHDDTHTIEYVWLALIDNSIKFSVLYFIRALILHMNEDFENREFSNANKFADSNLEEINEIKFKSENVSFHDKWHDLCDKFFDEKRRRRDFAHRVNHVSFLLN